MLRMGDVMVIPAGISHCSSTSSSDYRFVVLFPRVVRPQRILVLEKLVPITDHYILQDQPKWQSVWCDDSSETAQRAKETLHVPLPSIDPLYGSDGHLVKIWADVSEAADRA